MFPQLPHRSRAALCAASAMLVATAIALAALRLQAPLIMVSVFGLPLVLAMYLYQADAHRDLPRRWLVVTTALAVAIGAGWAWLTGVLFADAYEIALFGPGTDEQTYLLGVVIPTGGAVLMLLPVAAARLIHRSGRAPLDGFILGAFSAVAFSAAATMIRLAPQLATGITAPDRPVSGLLVQAGIVGAAIPLTAAAVGGLVGAALWSGRPRLIVVGVVAALGLYAASGLLEVSPLLHGQHLALHVVIAVVAVLALRIGLQNVPPYEPDGGRRVRRTSPAKVLAVLGACVGVAAAGGVAAAALLTPPPAPFVCPPDCGSPPFGEEIESNPRFVSADGAFTVQYPGPGTAYEATLNPDGVQLDFVAGDTGTMHLFGMPAQNQSAKQIAQDLIDEHLPDAVTDYEIPNAMVGYEPGYGVVVDEYGPFDRTRAIVMVAVKYDYALVAAAIGPYREFTPDDGPAHPSAANLQLAMDMGKYVNSFRWRDLSG
ncbi:zinc ribbon domain-containing protein [Mycolicibacterium pulveris]|uniref:zinc ribbon domain-containing protein n=1 Tax=Mycolicibacterium pulveris TaxID=36813 RepID=UPI003CF1E78C